tara:strand:+ start:4049 stop:5365 length:1317 start_codon:yes stop_codon:yes gene_type:complete
LEVFQRRREKLAHFIKGSAMVLTHYPKAWRNHDVDHPFRQDSSIYYLSGYEEAESIFIFRPGHSPESVLFVQPKDEVAEMWEGRRLGPEKAKELYQVDACYPITELEDHLSELLLPVDKVYYEFHKNPEFDKLLLQALEDGRRSRGRTGLGIPPILDAKEMIGEMRLYKDAEEIEVMATAARISAEAHREAMKFVSPGVNERQVCAVLEFVFKMRGADRIGYNPIVATGDNATVLHYNSNNQECKEFDLLLIDSGCEYRYYTADITRTFPVSGTFTSAQKDFYDAVLNAQKAVLEVCKPGTLFKDLHEISKKHLSQSIHDLGLIKESADTILNEELYKKYFPHGTGHWLGLDVHDVGAYLVDGESRPLEENMYFTVEPGLYVPQDDSTAPEQFRGMGVRIEDNILITSDGYKNLTETVPKEVKEIEDLMQQESLLTKI